MHGRTGGWRGGSSHRRSSRRSSSRHRRHYVRPVALTGRLGRLVLLSLARAGRPGGSVDEARAPVAVHRLERVLLAREVTLSEKRVHRVELARLTLWGEVGRAGLRSGLQGGGWAVARALGHGEGATFVDEQREERRSRDAPPVC